MRCLIWYVYPVTFTFITGQIQACLSAFGFELNLVHLLLYKLGFFFAWTRTRFHHRLSKVNIRHGELSESI